jgi:hypothetical protein
LSLAKVTPLIGFHHAVELAWWPRHVGHQHSTGECSSWSTKGHA